MDLGETVDSEGCLVVVQGGRFLAPGIAYFGGFWLVRLRNVRLAALNLEEDLRSGSRWSRVRIGDSENLRFSFKFIGFSLSLNVTFLRRFGHFNDLYETVDSEDALVVVQGGHLWNRNSLFDGY